MTVCSFFILPHPSGFFPPCPPRGAGLLRPTPFVILRGQEGPEESLNPLEALRYAQGDSYHRSLSDYITIQALTGM